MGADGPHQLELPFGRQPALFELGVYYERVHAEQVPNLLEEAGSVLAVLAYEPHALTVPSELREF